MFPLPSLLVIYMLQDFIVIPYSPSIPLVSFCYTLYYFLCVPLVPVVLS